MGQQLSSDSGAWGYGLDTPFGRQPGSQPLFLSAATGGNDQGARGGQWAGISGDPLNTFTERTVSMIICKGEPCFLDLPWEDGYPGGGERWAVWTLWVFASWAY